MTIDFDLIETLLWTRAHGFFLMEEHARRLAASAAALGFPFEPRRARDALAACVANGGAEALRVRLTLSPDGRLAAGSTPFSPPPADTEWRIVFAETRLDSADPLLRHKTTRRAFLDDALADASQRYGADEVVFLNERDEVCEGARANLFLAEGAQLTTPPLACGLLPGTLRAALLQAGLAVESVLTAADMSAASRIYLGNSVRGLIPARLIGPGRDAPQG